MNDEVITITIRDPSKQKSYNIDVETSIYVNQICDELLSILDCLPGQFCCLYFNGMELNDHMTLREQGITHGSQLIAEIKARKKPIQKISIRIFVPVYNKSYNINVNRKSEVRELCQKIENILQLPPFKRIFLTYMEIRLDKSHNIEYYGISDNAYIQCNIESLGGAFDPFQFSNMDNMELQEPAENGKPWRYAKSGLNLPGICKNENCEAYNFQVICPKGNGTFNIAKEIENMVCPQCKSDKVTAEGDCYFWDCIYSFNGCAIVDGQKMKKEQPERECPKGQFVHILGKEQEDLCSWQYLEITTRKM